MRGYEITIDIGYLLNYSKKLKTDANHETLLVLIKNYTNYIKALYMSMLGEEIYSDRYDGYWEPINDPDYIDFLGTQPYRNGIEELLVESIVVEEIKDRIIISHSRRFRYPKSHRYLNEVIQAIDSGTSKFNARTLIKPIVKSLTQTQSSLWKNFISKEGIIY